MKISMLFAGLFTSVLFLGGCSSTTTPDASSATAAQNTPIIDTSAPGLQATEQLPFQQFTDIDGNSIPLNNGKRQLLVFFATWCSDSQRAMRQLMASDLVKQADLQIVGIGREEDEQSLQQFKRVYGLNFALVADEKRELYRQVAEKGIPQLVTVDAQGQVQQVLLGEVPDAISLLHW